MPKIINYEDQKRHIAMAAQRLIWQDGQGQATVRKIAQEADMSAGALRHCFASQEALFSYVMTLVAEQVRARLNATEIAQLTPDTAVDLLCQLIPLDEAREIEMTVWLNFSVMAARREDMQPLNAALYDEIHAFILRLLEILQQQKMISSTLHLEAAATTLQLLIDALSLHRLIQPERFSETTIRTHLADHLHALSK